MELKQVILVRNDLKLPKGKLAVQVAHASVEASIKTLNKNKELFNKWLNNGAKKIVLKVDNLKELINYFHKSKQMNLNCALITDAAKTFFKEPTTSCLGIGPDNEDKIDELTKNLKML